MMYYVDDSPIGGCFLLWFLGAMQLHYTDCFCGVCVGVCVCGGGEGAVLNERLHFC